MKRSKGPPTLYPHQEIGVDAIIRGLTRTQFSDKFGTEFDTKAFLLWDEMGLGKTIQTLEAIKRMNLPPDSKILIICPSSALHIWSDKDYVDYGYDAAIPRECLIVVSYDTILSAYKSFIKNGIFTDEQMLKLCIVHGRPTQRLNLLTTRDQVRRELMDLIQPILESVKMPKKINQAYVDLFNTRYAICVMDEVHRINNVDSKRTRAVAMICAEYRLALSGTPVMNHGSELLCIIRYALGLYNLDWTTIYRDPSGDYCTRLLGLVTMGRKKSHVEGIVLPKRSKGESEIVYVKWSDPWQRRCYVATKMASIEMYEEMSTMVRMTGENLHDFAARKTATNVKFMTTMQKLRQQCLWVAPPTQYHWSPLTHGLFSDWMKRRILCLFKCCTLRLGLTRMAAFHVVRHFVRADIMTTIQPSPKMVAFWDIYEAHPDTKTVCFSSFRTFLEKTMMPWLTQIGVPCLLFCGGLTRAAKQRILEQFETDDTIRILLLVKETGSESLNLQQAASVCVIMDPHFNYGKDEQAAQRIDRIGQQREVIVRRLYMEGSIDEAIRILQVEKQTGIDSWFKLSDKRSLQMHGLFLCKYDTVQ
jgi:SNF2 family DNA or RNA helicase